MRSVFIGFDPRWASAFAVARSSVAKSGIPVSGIVLSRVRRAGLYWRPTEMRGDQLWDVISDAPMATEFAISRFLTPTLAGGGWALFMDCDMLIRGDLVALFDKVEKEFADKPIVCVKHQQQAKGGVKMGGQAQTAYPRKNWSSFVFYNVDHPANQGLSLALINEARGRDLHRFCWLQDDEIGELPPEWNWLAGHSSESLAPANVHWTDGIPLVKGFENAPYADEFSEMLADWAEGRQPA